MLDAGSLAAHVETTVDLAVELAAARGSSCGSSTPAVASGSRTRSTTTRWTSGGWARAPGVADRLADAEATRRARLLLEPGRFLVGSAGVYVTAVVDRKSVGGHHVVIVDGGIHHLVRPALVGQEHRLRVLTGSAATRQAANAQRFPVTVAGPLCSGLDVFAAATVMALPDPGDLVAILDVGAYGATESMPFFLSHALPPEIALRGGAAWVARPRVEPEVWLGWQA